jgi:hypothetical protein
MSKPIIPMLTMSSCLSTNLVFQRTRLSTNTVGRYRTLLSCQTLRDWRSPLAYNTRPENSEGRTGKRNKTKPELAIGRMPPRMETS